MIGKIDYLNKRTVLAYYQLKQQQQISKKIMGYKKNILQAGLQDSGTDFQS